MNLHHTFFNFLGCLAFLILPISAQAAPPDLTAPGVIATINRSETYNLGATGLRGWIYLDRSGGTQGADGTMTGESRQILVTVASAPANTVLAVDDVILGAMAASSGTVPAFSSDARKAFGAAIGEAENTGAGTLRVKRWRAGTTSDVNIPMTTLGAYSTTAPYSCPKSTLILANARTKLVGQLLANSEILTNNWKGAINGLALLAGVQPADPDYAAVQSRLQAYARARASTGPQAQGLPLWDWAYSGLFLAEYYLATGDANVLPGISSYTLKLAQSQSIQGTFGHDPSAFRPDGSGRRVGIGYGPVNAVGIVANMAIVLGKKALLTGGQAVDPAINDAIQRGSDFFAFYVNKGPIPYGEHEPFINGHSSNGKDPMCAVLFGLQAGRAVETEYYSRLSIASYNGREYGHTGQGFSYLWGALGANMGGSIAVAEYLKPVRWHLDLSRRTDGSFAYDGAEQYGGGSTTDGSYLGASGYYGMNPTATYILTYSLPLKRLYITGKRDTPANPPPLTLDSTTVAHAVAAANINQDVTGFTIAQLITSLTDYDPVVRHYAATELGKRAVTSTDLTTLRNMLTGSDANGRMGACQALGLLQDTTALPVLVQRLDKTIETNLWVRAKAASAIRNFPPATASSYRDPLLTAFIANATDPDVIVWNDPIQMSNNYLSFTIFGDSIAYGNNISAYTINAAKSLLYPAVQTGLKQPDSYSRAGAAQFCFDYLPLADVQANLPDFFKVIEIECLADRMWNAASRSSGIETLSKYQVSEGIPYAMAMLEIPPGFEHGSEYIVAGALNALATYGDAARWTLPKLKSYLGRWAPTGMENTALVSAIASIESATTAPVQAPGLAVAHSQTLSTTGPKAITLTGSSPRSAVTFIKVTAPAHGTLTGALPNLTYTPAPGYTGPDFFKFQVVDSLGASYPSAQGTVSIIVGTAGTGLKGEYFDNIDFTNLKLTRTDPQVNFDWGTGSPNALLGADTFSVRWSGLVLVPETGAYTFSTLNSDGVRLYVDGVLVIDDFTDHNGAWKDSATVNLTKGQLVDLDLRYFENTGSAVAKLKWTGPSFAGANGVIIGSQWLFDGTGTTRVPYAHSQSISMIRNTPQAITLTGSGLNLSYSIVTPPAHGTLSGTPPNLTYTPATNYSGTDSFTFLVNNGNGNSSPTTISINISEGLPMDFYWAAAASGNWSGATSWTNSSNATVVPSLAGQSIYRMFFNQPGTYTATHDLNTGYLLNQLNTSAAVTINGTKSLTFSANGPTLPQFNQHSSNEVSVSVPINLNATTQFGGSGGGKMSLSALISGTGGLTKNSPGVLKITNPTNTYSGGTIINRGTLLLDAVANAGLGTGSVALNGGQLYLERITAANPLVANGGEIYSANGFGNSWNGPVTLNSNLIILGRSYAKMTFNGSISGVGGITIKGDGPVVLEVPNTYSGPTSVTASTLECNNKDALGSGSLSISSVANSKVKLNFTGTRNITALTLGGVPQPAGTYGSTSSPATNKNDTYFSGTGTVTAGAPNSAPVAAAQSVTTPEDTAKSITLNATDANGNPLTYAIVTYPTQGVLSGIAPNLTYTPMLHYNGADSFTFKANDGNSDSAPATVTVTVTAVNDAPIATNQSVIVKESTAKALTLVGDDVEASPLIFSIVTQPAHGVLSGTPPNVNYTSTAGYYGSDSFTFRANDGSSNSNIATVSIAVNTPPLVNAGPDQTVSLSYTAPTTGWSYAPWTGDSDAGLSSNYIYTAAHSFGNNRASVIVNGVTFTESTNTSGTGWSIGGSVSFVDGDDDAAVTGNSELLAQEFIYNGNPRTVTFSGLTVGQTYEASFFSVAWETGTRSQLFSTPGVTSATINQDQYGNNMGIRIKCVYTAAATSQVFTITPQIGGTFHLYAMANRVAPSSTTSVNLAGTVSDANSDPLTTAWTYVSGPLGVAIVNVSALNTTATFQSAGTYVLRLTGDDGLGPVSDTITITVNPESPYVTWSGSANFGSDTNGDGISNGLAWALGASGPSANATSLLPTFDNISNVDYVIFNYRRSDTANTDPNTTISVQYGNDLNNWITAVHDGTNIIITPTNNFYGISPGVDKVEVRIKRTLVTTGKLFTRLRVNKGS